MTYDTWNIVQGLYVFVSNQGCLWLNLAVIPKIMRQMCYKIAQKSYICDTFQHLHFLFCLGTRVLIVDQWIETGGTMHAATKMVEDHKGTVTGSFVT